VTDLLEPVPVTIAVRPRQSIRFRGRSFMALVLAPTAPLEEWLAEIDAATARSPGFFSSRAIIIDISHLSIAKAELAALIAALDARGIRIMAIEGAGETALGLGFPPPVSGGRPAGAVEMTETARPAPAPTPAPPASGATLMVEESVRSGTSIVHLEGDVTVIGSVASGAEVVSGGSIHVYGTLRGRAIAGTTGNAGAKIFCRRLEAELLAIDGLYKTADDLGADNRGQAVQVSLSGDTLVVKPLD
jgi:septum site-determining protein MinC